MTAADVLRQPLHVPYGGGFDVPPPSARVALRTSLIMQALNKAAVKGEEVDMVALSVKMGVDPDTYDMNVDLLGADLYEELLDRLNSDEFSTVIQAMFVWVMPGGSKEDAELFLQDPTQPRPAAGNRQARRRKVPAQVPAGKTARPRPGTSK